MSRFIHIEDNGDETVTITTNVFPNVEEITVVFPLNLDQLLSMIPTEALEKSAEDLNEIGFVHIPNNPEDS